ncbi:MAG TPA: GNAT family N-acetyltransferase [Actinospica sp.]|nr:GNAT family N-acetyltransferase [Actinospica sp.]
MALEVRNIATEDEFDAFCDAMDVGFYAPQDRGDGRRRRSRYPDLGRLWAGFDGGQVVSTFISNPLELTVPGGAQVPMSGITGVTVSATHRRRGLASRMMNAELTRAKEAGEAIAGLIAAEYPIYGRYGFGAASEAARWTVDARDLRFQRALPGTVELVDPAVARVEAEALWDRIRARQNGAVSREGWRWDKDTGQGLREGEFEPRDVLHALCRDEHGQTVGYTTYRHIERWTNQRPDNDLTATVLIATDPVYEARLWQYLAGHDWTSRVIGPEADRVDALWRDLLVDRRMAVPGNVWDFVWLRLLDPAAALAARKYAGADRLVLRVEDKDGYAQGVFALETAGDGTAVCGPSLESADVTLAADRLAAIYLGGYTAARYAALGLLEEHTAGAAERLSTLFATGLAPHNPMLF